MSKQTNRSDLNAKSTAELQERGELEGFQIRKCLIVVEDRGNSCLRRLRIAVFKLVLITKPDFIAEPPRALSALGFTGYLFIMARSF